MKYEIYDHLLSQTEAYYEQCILFADWGHRIQDERLRGKRTDHLREIRAELDRARSLLDTTIKGD